MSAVRVQARSPDTTSTTVALPGWHGLAACRLMPDLDFTDPKGPQVDACRVVCSVCPVRLACARDALQRGEPWGMWGGLDRVDRRDLAKTHGWPPPSVLPPHGTNARYAKHRCPCTPCRQAHAQYEAERRHRARESARRAAAWSSHPVVLVRPARGRTAPGCGQYVLPLPGIPVPRVAVVELGPERTTPGDTAAAA